LNSINVGKKIFLAGIFLLPSALGLSSIFFILSSFISIKHNFKVLIKDKFNLYLITASILFTIISFFHAIKFNFISLESIDSPNLDLKSMSWDPSVSFLGIANWVLIFFFVFIGCQSYLGSNRDRKAFSKWLIIGSFPVLITGFGQYWLGWYGPFEILNGFIKWYLKPIHAENFGLAGLFSNQNYTGCWLNIILPFSLSFFLENNNSKRKKIISIVFLLILALAISLTGSRNALLGMFLSIPLVLETTAFFWLFFLIFVFTIFLIFLSKENLSNLFPNELFENILPESILIKLKADTYIKYSQTRFDIYTFAINMISQSPFLGWGAGSFSIYNYLSLGSYVGHPHNLILDLAFNYGAIICLVVFGFIFYILFNSFKSIYFDKENKVTNYNEKIFEKAWWTSFFILLLSQMFDVQYYDGRISISFWALIAGLKMILQEKQQNSAQVISK